MDAFRNLLSPGEKNPGLLPAGLDPKLLSPPNFQKGRQEPPSGHTVVAHTEMTLPVHPVTHLSQTSGIRGISEDLCTFCRTVIRCGDNPLTQ